MHQSGVMRWHKLNTFLNHFLKYTTKTTDNPTMHCCTHTHYHIDGLNLFPAGKSVLTGEAAVCDVEHKARSLDGRLSVPLGRLLLRCFDFFPSILFTLDFLCYRERRRRYRLAENWACVFMAASYHGQWDVPFFTSATSVLSLASIASVAVGVSLSFSFSSAAFTPSAGKNTTTHLNNDLLHCSTQHQMFCLYLISLLWPLSLALFRLFSPLFSPLLECHLFLSSPPVSGRCLLCLRFSDQGTHCVMSLLSKRKAMERSTIALVCLMLYDKIFKCQLPLKVQYVGFRGLYWQKWKIIFSSMFSLV